MMLNIYIYIFLYISRLYPYLYIYRFCGQIVQILFKKGSRSVRVFILTIADAAIQLILLYSVDKIQLAAEFLLDSLNIVLFYSISNKGIRYQVKCISKYCVFNDNNFATIVHMQFCH